MAVVAGAIRKRVIAERFDTAPDASSANFMKNSERNERNKGGASSAFFNYACRDGLVHVFPVFAVQCPSNNEEDREEQHDLFTHFNSGLFKRLRSVSQEVHQVIHCIIKLVRGHNARRRHFE